MKKQKKRRGLRSNVSKTKMLKSKKRIKGSSTANTITLRMMTISLLLIALRKVKKTPSKR